MSKQPPKDHERATVVGLLKPSIVHVSIVEAFGGPAEPLLLTLRGDVSRRVGWKRVPIGALSPEALES